MSGTPKHENVVETVSFTVDNVETSGSVPFNYFHKLVVVKPNDRSFRASFSSYTTSEDGSVAEGVEGEATFLRVSNAVLCKEGSNVSSVHFWAEGVISFSEESVGANE